MKFDIKLIGYMTTFENFTKSNVKDCFLKENKELVFVVKEGQLWQAIGKNGINIKKLAVKLRHKIKVIGFDNDPAVFLKNLLYPIEGYDIEKEDGKLIIKPHDTKIKGQIYGRDRSNFKWIKGIFNRHFNGIEVVMG